MSLRLFMGIRENCFCINNDHPFFTRVIFSHCPLAASLLSCPFSVVLSYGYLSFFHRKLHLVLIIFIANRDSLLGSIIQSSLILIDVDEVSHIFKLVHPKLC